ncbi:MAG: hypothetical protein AVDCRST_MAG61-804, partial [uncultured Friedmanniella sp.]
DRRGPCRRAAAGPHPAGGRGLAHRRGAGSGGRGAGRRHRRCAGAPTTAGALPLGGRGP